MGRKIKQGFEYFPLDTDFFTGSQKIKALRRAHGSIGILTYMYLLCRIYTNGYYFEFYDLEELAYDIAENIANEQIRRVTTRVTETINYLVERGMLDEALFKRGIISGVAMQEQYIRSALAAKRKIELDVHCLVDVGDCIRKIREEKGKSSEEKGISSEEITISSEESTQSKSKSKSKNNNSLLSLSYARAKERNEDIEKYGKWENVYLSPDEYYELESVIPHFSDYVDYFSNKLIDRGYQYSNHYETIISWWNTDRYTVGSEFGVDDIWHEVYESFCKSKKG